MTVNDKYVVGQADSKIKCFDIYGNKIAEFNNNGKAFLDGNLIICNNRVYNIADNKISFEDDDINIEKIDTYYSKFFTVKKKNGTSALYSADGKTLIDFGKWDYIYPSSVSSNIVVSVNGKYGVADYNGNLLLPLEYGIATVFVSRKNPMYYSQLSDNGKYVVFTKNSGAVSVDLSTLKCHISSSKSFYIGNKYHKCGSQIIDNSFNIVYSDESINYVGKVNGIDNGVIKQIYLI